MMATGAGPEQEVRMIAVKALALGALVVGSAILPAMAGPITPAQLVRAEQAARRNALDASPGFTPHNPAAGPATVNTAAQVGYIAPMNFQSSKWAAAASTNGSDPGPSGYQVLAAPASQVSTVGTASGQPVYDAFINMSDGKFLESDSLTTGGGTAWYNSPVVAQLFGGVPDTQQRASFMAKVVADVKHTYDLAHVPIRLTADPNATAAHTLSVVSNTSFSANANAIGITDVGANGFSFIDKLTGTQTIDRLALAVGHNIAHELMHAFGVAAHHDTTGNYIDSGMASWSLLTDPDATFSPDAVKDLLARNFAANNFAASLGAQVAGHGPHPPGCNCSFCTGHFQGHVVGAQMVPEPSTIALWAVAGGCLLLGRPRPRAAA